MRGRRETGVESGVTRGGLTDPMLMKNPKVAADEPMNLPSVAMDPLGPGPARTMDVRPKMKPMVRPTPAARQCSCSTVPVWEGIEAGRVAVPANLSTRCYRREMPATSSAAPGCGRP